MKNDTDVLAGIKAAIATYQAGYSKKDIKMLLDATDPDYFGFGSGHDEKVWSAEALKLQLERDFAHSGDLSMDFGKMTIFAEGNAAWCAGDCTISANVGGKRVSVDGRMTIVLRRAGDKWLFAHTHFSVPDRMQQEGQSFPEK
jgi:ketosteroid isomerase-like protein